MSANEIAVTGPKDPVLMEISGVPGIPRFPQDLATTLSTEVKRLTGFKVLCDVYTIKHKAASWIAE